MILADAETLGGSGTEEFVTKIAATATVCAANLKGQQFYIDLWRDLAKSGVLAFPSK